MKSWIFFFAVYLAASSVLYAQRKDIIENLINRCNENPQHDSVLVWSQTSLDLSKQVNYQYGIASSCLIIGDYYAGLDYFSRSTEFLLQGLPNAEIIGDTVLISAILQTLADNYLNEDPNIALQYQNKFLDVTRNSRYQEKYLLGLMNLGNIYFTKNNYKNALHYYEQCEIENKQLLSIKISNGVRINKGMVYYKLGDYKNSLKNFKEALVVDDGFRDRKSFLYKEMASVYLTIGDLKEAIRCLELANQHLSGLSSQLHQEVYNLYYKVYKAKNNHTKGLEFLEKYNSLKNVEDSLLNKQIIRLSNLDYENEKNLLQLKEQEIRLLQNRNRLVLLFTLVGFMSLIIFGIWVSRRNLQRKNHVISSQKDEILDLNTNLEAKVKKRTNDLMLLQQKMAEKNQELINAEMIGQSFERKRLASTLHDNLGGSIAAIKWQISGLKESITDKNKANLLDSIYLSLQNIYEEVRYFSHAFLPDELEKDGFFAAIEKLFTDLNKSEIINFKIDNDETIFQFSQKESLEIYSACLEIVTNSIKHSNAKNITISFKRLKNELMILVEDDGDGFLKNELAIPSGKGIKNIKERMKRINGTANVESSPSKGVKWVLILSAKETFT